MKREIPLDQETLVSSPGVNGKGIDFQHNGVFYTLPKGVTKWPYEIAERLQRKFAPQGVRIVHSAPEPEPVAPAVMEGEPFVAPVVVSEAPAVVVDGVLEVLVAPVPDEPVAEPEAPVHPVADAEPEHPAEQEDESV